MLSFDNGKNIAKVKEELLKDFYAEMNKLDFSDYNPASQEFMKPLSIGMMWQMLCDMKEKGSAIEDEIDGASTYMDMWKRTGEPSYKQMASDELRHANMLITISKHNDEEEDYSDYEMKISAIQKQMI